MGACNSCGGDNPDIARFCLHCGAPLEAAEAFRKTVTVLFCDIADSTALGERLDPEDLNDIMTQYFDAMRPILERHGGTVAKFIGDAIMAVFGIPTAHEDDALRAVRAADEMQSQLAKLNEALEARWGIRIATRTGINTGEVAGKGLVPDRNFVAGDVANVAARLQQSASPGDILIGEPTFTLVRDAVQSEHAKEIRVKGKQEPVQGHRLIAVRSRFGIDVERHYKTPFIGRELDLATLKTAYQRTVREASVQLVTITGEPGVGKTRLLAEFSSFIDDQDEIVYWRQGRSLPYGEGITFWALGEIIKAQAGILESDSPETASDKLQVAVEAVVEETDERTWFVARLGPLVGAKAAQSAGVAEKEESFTAWRRFLEAIAARGPLVLVFEDLHWADATMLEFIDHLVEWSTGVPLLVVCTARPELYESHQGWGGGKRNSNTISLSALSDSEAAQLISALLSQAVLPAEIHAALLERAGGNPLYAEEFIRMLSDRGVLQQRGRTLALDPTADIPVPDNVQALIVARLDTLPSDRKSLLHNAAVVGKVFWSGAIAAVDQINDGELKQGLHELVRKELVRPARSSSVERQYEYSFWHALIRDVAYGQIPRSLRAAKHQSVARWLEGVAGERSTDYAEVLAHHFMQAFEAARASGRTVEIATLASQTSKWLVSAGDRALELNPAQARQYFETALRMMPEQEAEQATVRSKLSAALTRLGHLAEARSMAEQAIEQLLRGGETQRAAESMVSLGDIVWHEGRPISEAISLCERAVRLLEGEPPGVGMVKALGNIALFSIFAGDPEKGLGIAEEAYRLAIETNSDEGLINALDARGTARHMLGDAKGIDDLREAVRFGTSRGQSRQTAMAYVDLGAIIGETLGAEPQLSVARDALSFMKDRGLVEWQLMSEGHVVDALIALGEWDEAEATADALIRRAGQLGSSQEKLFGKLSKLYITAWRGQTAEALEMLPICLEEARRIKDAQTYLTTLGLGAQVYCLSQKANEALPLLREFEKESRPSPYYRFFNLDVIRACIACGEVELAKSLSSAGPSISLNGSQAHIAVSIRAILAEAETNFADARTSYEEASQAWEEYGDMFEHSQAHLGLARCLIALGDRGAATDPLQKARAIFNRLGARPLIDEVDRHLGQATALSS